MIRYIQMCESCQEQIESISQQIETLGLKIKKPYREIDRELLEEIKRASERGRMEQLVYPSFMGMQLKRYMGIG